MATFVVKLAPASEGDQLRCKINEAVKTNLPFGFPDHRFEFVEEDHIDEQFVVTPSFSAKPDELAESWLRLIGSSRR